MEYLFAGLLVFLILGYSACEWQIRRNDARREASLERLAKLMNHPWGPEETD